MHYEMNGFKTDEELVEYKTALFGPQTVDKCK